MRCIGDLNDNPFFRDVYREGGDEGRLKGRQEGRQEVLRKILGIAPYPVPDAVMEFIDQAGEAQLDRMILAMVKADSFHAFAKAAELPPSLHD